MPRRHMSPAHLIKSVRRESMREVRGGHTFCPSSEEPRPPGQATRLAVGDVAVSVVRPPGAGRMRLDVRTRECARVVLTEVAATANHVVPYKWFDTASPTFHSHLLRDRA